MQRLAIVFIAAGAFSAASAGEWDVAADIALQSRVFVDGAQWPGQDGARAQLTLSGSAELRWRSDDDSQRAAVVPYARWDGVDAERSLIDLRELYWAREGEGVDILIGANVVFWGVTESVHLVDVINQTDFAADIDGEDKLGQPMLNVAIQRDWGQVSAYVLPYFRERTFAGGDGRFRATLPVDTSTAVFESGAGRRHVDVALRYSHYIGDVDIGVYLFRGTGREPRLLPSVDGSSLVPHYDQISQVGVDLQYTRDAWLWKLEAIARNGATDNFVAAVGGFEVTSYQVAGSSADLGWLLEYQYDGRDAGEPLSIADSDIFAGARLSMNDTQDTAVLAGLAWDHRSGERFVNVEAERRIGDSFVVEFRLRAFSGAERTDPTYALRTDDYVQLQLARFF
ncbi:MAG: hypothetical protein R3288_12375 [Woeseiaceae bacterium]|nr:hypothetical protein [Woeseiaceae bacterium]